MTPAERQMINGMQASSTRSEQSRRWATGHDVQFYEKESFLVTGVANFLADGVRAGQPIIVIATASHRNEFAEKMRAMGVDPDDLVVGRDAVVLDARETLAAFMEGSRPNAELFNATVGNVFEKLMKNRPYVVVRAYGEMVDVLWNEGKAEAAIALEELWNGLATKFSFSLLCAYSQETLGKPANGVDIRHICAQHSRVLPFEADMLAGDP